MTRVRILTIGRTDVQMHLSTPLFALYALFTGHGVLWGIATLSILVHEGAHALTAALLGSPPEQIELTPIGAVMRLDDERRLTSGKRLLMLLAGPLSTLLLCLLALKLTKNGLIAPESGRTFFISNLGILLMNLLPALPLDGGRVLALLTGLLLPVHQMHRVMRVISSVAGVALICLNLAVTWRCGGWNLSLAFAGCSILYSASAAATTHAMAELRMFLDRRIRLERRESLPCILQMVLEHQPLRKAVRRLHPRCLMQFIILESGTMKQLAAVTEFELVEAYLQNTGSTFGDMVLSTKFAKSDISSR